jgi:hypothetical protein
MTWPRRTSISANVLFATLVARHNKHPESPPVTDLPGDADRLYQRLREVVSERCGMFAVDDTG